MTITADNALFGHVSPDSAYVVEDYPYGFRLRTTIRYWIESAPRRGDRFVSQTRNPKAAGAPWNTPKKSTYAPIGVMYLDEEGHVTWASVGNYPYVEALAAFTAAVGDNLLPIQAKTLEVISRVTWCIAAKDAGAQAHAEGAERIVPQSILVEWGTRPAEAWYRGWDAHNLATEAS